MRPAGDGRSTRRQLMGGLGLAAAAAALGPGRAAAAGGQDPATARQHDLGLLQKFLAAEGLLIYGCHRLLRSGLLSPDSGEVVGLVLGHEQEHAAVLQDAIRARGGSPGLADATHPPADVVALFAAPRTEADFIRALIDVESFAQYAYFQGIGQLQDPALAQAAAEIMACEAQHWSLLADLTNHGLVYNAVPGPYVRGSPHLPTG